MCLGCSTSKAESSFWGKCWGLLGWSAQVTPPAASPSLQEHGELSAAAPGWCTPVEDASLTTTGWGGWERQRARGAGGASIP